MLLAVGEATHDDARQSVLALEPYKKVLIGDGIENQPSRLMRLDLPPMLAPWRIGRSLDDAIILGAVGIRQDDQPPLMVIGRVIVLGLARRDEARRRARIGGIDQADLGRLMIVHAEQKEAAVLGRAEAEEISRVGLFVDDGVAGLGADHMPQHAARAMFVIEPDVKQRAAVGRPFQRAVGVGDAGIEESAGRSLDDVDRVEFGAFGIDGVGDQSVVGAVRDAGDAEISVRLGERVAVEQDLLFSAGARHAAEQRVLPADDEAAVIGESSIRSRNAGVIFLDAALHLGEQLRLDLFGVGHDGL